MATPHSLAPAPPATISPEDHSGAKGDRQLVQLWLSSRPATTARAYLRDTERLLAYLASVDRSIRTVTLLDLQDYVDGIEGKPRTRARRIASLRSLLAFAHRTGYARFDVSRALQVPRTSNELAERILTEEQVHRLLSAEVGRSPALRRRNHVLLRLLYVAGLRVSEVAGLQWQHLHEREGEQLQLTAHGKGGKTRHILLTPTVSQQLLGLRWPGARAEDPVFHGMGGTPLGARAIRQVVVATARKAGIEASVSPHWLRHAHASHALDRGAPIHLVQQDLGHASVGTTSQYLHARPSDGSAKYLPA